ncbi:MAG: hypothetical protein U0Y68_15900 [Blastocatellia bacterium]
MREILNELRRATKGGIADYSGITYEKIEKQGGVFWPCPSDDHKGTERLFEAGSWNWIAKGAGPFYFHDGKARFNVAPYTPPAEDVDAEYPIISGRRGVSSVSFCPARKPAASARWSSNILNRALKFIRNWLQNSASRTAI